MQILHTEVRIKASPETIWKALAESSGIPEEIRKALHDRNTRQFLSVPMSAGGRSVTLTVKILAVDPFREIRWKGYFWIPGLFDGEHSFEIREDTGGQTLLVQREIFSGLLLPFLSRTLTVTKEEFERMNAEIRNTAERDVGLK